MDEVHHSSAYSSLANSTTEINMGEEASKCSSEQLRHITEDYNALLRRATKEIKGLTREKFDLQERYEKLMSVNEELIADVERLLKKEAELKEENEAVIAANSELFEEAQRLSDEEEKWILEKERFEKEIADLKEEVESIEAKVSAADEHDQGLKRDIQLLREEKELLSKQRSEENKSAVEAAAKLEAQILSLRSRVNVLEGEKEMLLKRKEKVAGENLQLMVDADNQTKQYYRKTLTLQTQLQKSEENCRNLMKENSRLRSQAEATDPTASQVQQTERLESLVEKNKNLTEWREQLVAKNKSLTEENAKLKTKCQNLEELLNEEETDINDVLELIKKTQFNAGAAVNVGSAQVGPISKFRDLKLK